MPWVRFDDQYPINRKIEALSDAAFRLNHCAIHWCARELTDGQLKAGELDLAAPRRMRNPRRHVAELVAAGLWEETADGWAIHDYHDYQPTKEQVIADRAATAERQRRWREKRKESRNGVTDGVTDASSNDSANATPPVRDSGDRNGVTDGVSNAAPSRPGPSRPAQDYVSTCATPSEPPAIFDADLVDDDTDPAAEQTETTTPVPVETAQTITKAWIDHCALSGVTLPRRIIGQYAKHIATALDEGTPAELIKRALASMLADAVADKPAWLPNRIVKAQTGPEVHRRAPATTTDDRVAGWLALGAKMHEEVST